MSERFTKSTSKSGATGSLPGAASMQTTPVGGDAAHADPSTPAEIQTAVDPRSLFQADITPRTPARAAREYVNRLRGGDPGALPAVLGLVLLVIIFSQVSHQFLKSVNLGNLPGQAAFIAVIALGLVFILILGEIDLAAGTTGGMVAAFSAQALKSDGLHKGLDGLLFWLVVAGLVGALALGIINKLIFAPIFVALALIILATGLDKHVFFALLFGVGVGFTVGTYIGVLVAKVGIPSFVVTLALFLAWEGVTLFALGSQPITVSSYGLWNGLANNNMKPWEGWLFFVVIIGAYLAVTASKAVRRRSAGLSADTLALVLSRVGALAVGGALVVFFLNRNRNPNPGGAIQGVPWALSVPIVLMIISTIVLTKTTWGRHLFATGGNQEAARRAGIKVDRIRISAFAVSSGLAALGGFFLSSFTGGVQLDIGQGNTLLFSVAAAVIGGTSLFGGRGKPRDAIIGAFVIAIIPNGIGLKPSLPPQSTEVITGVVLLLAASVDAISRRRSRSR